eukprot:tig00000057_g58.t1
MLRQVTARPVQVQKQRELSACSKVESDAATHPEPVGDVRDASDASPARESSGADVERKVAPAPRPELPADGIIPEEELEIDYEHLIGKGYGCKVFPASWRGHPVAIKRLIMQGALSRGPTAVHAEIAVLRTLDHPNIVKFYGSSPSPSIMLIVTELAEGTLRTPARPLGGPREIVLGMLCVAEALVYLAARGIVHGDIRPENILVFESANGRPLWKLCDFSGGHSELYAPPEAASDDYLDQTEAYDAWSLALVIWELLSPNEKLEDCHKKGRVPPPVDPSWPEPLRALLVRCWDSNPDARPGYRALHAALQAALPAL